MNRWVESWEWRCQQRHQPTNRPSIRQRRACFEGCWWKRLGSSVPSHLLSLTTKRWGIGDYGQKFQEVYAWSPTDLDLCWCNQTWIGWYESRDRSCCYRSWRGSCCKVTDRRYWQQDTYVPISQRSIIKHSFLHPSCGIWSATRHSGVMAGLFSCFSSCKLAHISPTTYPPPKNLEQNVYGWILTIL